MDQYLSTVIIAIITGVFSVITLLIQKKQDKVISKIDEQTLFIEREKALKQKLTKIALVLSSLSARVKPEKFLLTMA